MESVTTNKPDVSRASDNEHLGSSSTANGFSVIHSYLSKRSYPTCLCVTAFQLVHFQITYHSSWWSYITQSYEMGLPLIWWWPYFQYMQQQEGTQDCRLFGIATAYCVAMHGWNPLQHCLQPKCNIKDVALGSWLFVVALMLITGSALHLFYVLVI